jgi:hypothetical protein
MWGREDVERWRRGDKEDKENKGREGGQDIQHSKLRIFLTFDF